MRTSHLLQHFANLGYEQRLVIQEFNKSHVENIFALNRPYLYMNSKVVKFTKDEWTMRPDIFCLDYYNVPYFYPIILMVNELSSVFEFTPENLHDALIIAPDKAAIIDILRQRAL